MESTETPTLRFRARMGVHRSLLGIAMAAASRFAASRRQQDARATATIEDLEDAVAIAETLVAGGGLEGGTTLDPFSDEVDEPALVLASRLLVRLVFDRATGEERRTWTLGSGRLIAEEHLLAAAAAYACERADHAIRSGDAAITASLVWHAHMLLREVEEADRALAAAQGRSRKAAELNAARHAKNRDAKALVVKEWLRDPSCYRSAERAGVALTVFLADRGFEIEPRTVTSWIRAAAKAHGIKLRP